MRFSATLEYEYAPIKLENAKIVISCSNKKRGLGDSKYNERRSECETALAEIQKVKDIKLYIFLYMNTYLLIP